MNSFSQIVERFAPSSWLDRGLTVRDDFAAPQPQSWRQEVGFARRGIVGVAAAGIFAASAIFCSEEAPVAATSTAEYLAATAMRDATEFSEVPQGYWPQMIEQVRALPALDESAFVDMDSLI